MKQKKGGSTTSLRVSSWNLTVCHMSKTYFLSQRITRQEELSGMCFKWNDAEFKSQGLTSKITILLLTKHKVIYYLLTLPTLSATDAAKAAIKV